MLVIVKVKKKKISIWWGVLTRMTRKKVRWREQGGIT